ncbi:hypothetical protein BEWA_036330 [Theileria equi strain WA]|uniref:Uncharacterized protein n=1 Tax=Theileria equi strain WA TaxID=1537102 RepID=L1LDS3_THEEQ|nr:hypothetical protein BEWA_036330 [Theileria equi strain WA]EKX73597.1 hypothetical protein BEWA_036330 [Theileria equi strain WA]|eukprot:XP_004833049.1 hypothetical protein BEWA_036330 [Theileria equi strain WA]
MLTLNLQNSQVFLWNNGNGRLVPKSSTLDSCPNVLDRQVTIDIGKNSDGWYGPSTITSKIDIFTTMLTNPELPGYQICHNTGPPFMVKSVVDGTTPTNIKVAQEVHNVYVYRWNNVPLLVDFELLNKEFLSFANLDNKWEGIKTPKSDYRRMHYLRELLGYINCRMGNRVVIDIWVKKKYSKYHIGACKFPGMEEKKGAAVIVENVPHKYGDLNGYQEFRRKLSNNKQFDIGHIMNSTRRVIIDLPNRPVKTVSLFTRPYGYTNNPLDIVEVVTDVYEYYYKHNRDKEFVKYAVSNEPLRKTNDLLHYETGKVILWKSKVIEKRYDL